MKKRVEVKIWVDVEIDETKFTEPFMEEFRESFYQFHDVDRHICHIGQLEARGLIYDDFIEGYGSAKDMGIKANVVEFEAWVDD